MGASNAKMILACAFRNIPAQGDWDLSDLKLYHAMRLLYAEYGMMLVDREQAAAEREQLVREWRKEKHDITL